MEVANIFEAMPDEIPREIFDELAGSGTVKIERILSFGQASPEGFWYDQERHEWVLLVRGSAGLRFEGSDEMVILKPGDWINIPAHTRHRVEWTDALEPTVWLAVHYA